MKIIHINDITDERISNYLSLKESQTHHTQEQIFLCDGDCQKTNITMGSFEFVVGTVVYPFTINYFECKSLQDPDSIGTAEINYFECLPDDCITIHS